MKNKILIIIIITVILFISIIPVTFAYTDNDIEKVMNNAATASSSFSSIKTRLEGEYGIDSVRYWYMYLNPNRKANCFLTDEEIKTAPNDKYVTGRIIDRNKIKTLIKYFYDSAESASKNKYNIKVTPTEVYVITMGEGFIIMLESYKKYGTWLEHYSYYCYKDRTGNIWTSGFALLGVDHFSDEASILKAGGFLRQDFKEGREYRPTIRINEKKKKVQSDDFSNFKVGIEAAGARIAWSKYLFLRDIKSLGVQESSISDDQIFFWTYYYFNAGSGNGKSALSKFVSNGKINDQLFVMGKSGTTVKNGCKARDNSIMRLATYKSIKELNIFV